MTSPAAVGAAATPLPGGVSDRSIGDVNVPDSDAWWAARLVGQLVDRRPRLEALWRRYSGDAPLPELGNPSATATRARVWKAFQRKARINLAELIIASILERLTPIGARVDREPIEGAADAPVREPQGASAASLAGRPTGPRATAAQGGDDRLNRLARRIWRANHLDLQLGELIEYMLVMGEAYTLTGYGETDSALPVITVEDPRNTITECDPARPYRDIAGLKLYADPVRQIDVLVLHRPGRVVRMERDQAIAGTKGRRSMIHSEAFRFDPSQWTVVSETDLSRWIGKNRIAISRVSNHDRKGEFEAETDHLDRIDHMILQRIIVATLQAFKQRAVKGVPTVDPKTGKEIDYSDIFTADPGALWLLPATAELWESGQVDLTPLLTSVKDDIKDLAAVLRLPIYQFSPDAANQSAEGASAAREGLIYRAEDRQVRCDVGLADMMSLALAYMGQSGTADDEQGPLEITTTWAPIERFSLAERYAAAAQANGITPWESIMTDILQYSPEDMPRLRAQRAEDALMAPAAAGEGRAGFTSGSTKPEPSSAGQSAAGTRSTNTTGAGSSNGSRSGSGGSSSSTSSTPKK